MIQAIVIVTTETDPKTGRKSLVASHGVDWKTGREFPVSQDHPAQLGARFDHELMEYVLDEPQPA